VPDPHPDLFAAAAAWFRSDAELTAAFPGGFVSGRGGVAQALPHARIGWRKPAAEGLSVEDEGYLVTLAAFASTDDAAANLGELLLAKFLDEARPPLAFTDPRGRAWREAARIEQDAVGPEFTGTIAAVDGGEEGDVWRYRVPVRVLVVEDEA
jgi:hypothetical protein